MDSINLTGPPELPKSVKLPAQPIVPEQSFPVEQWDDGADDDKDDLNEHVVAPGDPDGVVAEEERRKLREARAAAAVSFAPAPPKHIRKRKWPTVVLVIVLVAAASFGAYWLGNNKAKTPDAKKSQTGTTAQTQQPAKTATVATKHYDSVTYTLGLDYPGDWLISDTTAKLTITSPGVKMTSVSGSTTGHVLVTIQNPQTNIPGFPSGGAMANLASDKLTYKQPSSVQRAQTYLSYLGYKNPNGLDALYLTGDNGYESGQQIPMSDVIKGNPLVSVTFVDCEDTSCVNGAPKPITLLASRWKDAAFKQQVIDLLQSLTLN